MKTFIASLVVDSGIFACWYFGLYGGIEGLLNISLFYMWFSAIAGIIMAALKPEDIFTGKKWHNPLSIAADIGFILIAIFHEFTVLAVFYSIATIVVYAKKQQYIDSYTEEEELSK